MGLKDTVHKVMRVTDQNGDTYWIDGNDEQDAIDLLGSLEDFEVVHCHAIPVACNA